MYDSMLTNLFELAPGLRNVNNIITYLDKENIQSIRSNFANVPIQCCYLHFITTLFKNWQNNNLIGAPINILYRSWTLALTHYQHFGEALDLIEPYCQLISNDFPTVINFFHFLRYDWGKILKELVEIRSTVSYTHLDSFVMTLSNKIGGAHENSWTCI
ncbi:hypothetical protein KQX54_012191, partial [Cotesia glomerata]